MEGDFWIRFWDASFFLGGEFCGGSFFHGLGGDWFAGLLREEARGMFGFVFCFVEHGRGLADVIFGKALKSKRKGGWRVWRCGRGGSSGFFCIRFPE